MLYFPAQFAALLGEGSTSPVAGMLFAGGVALMLFGVWSSLRRKLRNPSHHHPTPPAERVQRLKERTAARDSIESLMVDAEELTRRLAAHLDNKAARIEHLLAEANEVLQRLESAAGSSGSGSMHQGSTHPLIQDPTTRSIYELADEGRSPIEIAEHLDEQVGKVELVLALREA